MSTKTTIKSSNGAKLKAAISGITKEELHQRAASLLPRLREEVNKPDSWGNDPAMFLASELHSVTEGGAIDLEYYADACDDLVKGLNDSDYGREFMSSLPKHTRQNIINWIGLWRTLFYSLYCYDRTDTLIDYHAASLPGGTLTEDQLLALEEKYTDPLE